MKKLFMFLAVAGLATFGTACSSSDDSGTSEPQLELKANKTGVKVNEEVTFTVTADGKNVDGASLTIDGVAVTGMKQSFKEEREYKVVASKSGFKTSGAVTIKVSKDATPPVQKQLVLSADKTAIKVGEVVAFSVNETGAVITGTNGATVVDGKFTATAAGTFVFKATKTGDFIDSNSVTVTVTGATTALVLKIADAGNLVGGPKTPVSFSAVDQDGNPVVGATLNFVGITNTFPMGDTGAINITFPVEGGTYKGFVNVGTLKSPEVSFVVKPGKVATGTGNIVFGSVTQAVTEEYFGVGGFDQATSTVTWMTQTWSKDYIVQQYFTTVVTLDAAGNIVSGFPNGTNTKGANLLIFTTAAGNAKLDGVEIVNNVVAPSAQLKISYNIISDNDPYLHGEVKTSAVLQSTKAFSINYLGDINEAEWNKAAAKAVSGSTFKANSTKLVKKTPYQVGKAFNVKK